MGLGDEMTYGRTADADQQDEGKSHVSRTRYAGEIKIFVARNRLEKFKIQTPDCRA